MSNQSYLRQKLNKIDYDRFYGPSSFISTVETKINGKTYVKDLLHQTIWKLDLKAKQKLYPVATYTIEDDSMVINWVNLDHCAVNLSPRFCLFSEVYICDESMQLVKKEGADDWCYEVVDGRFARL
jgi:hypothetical protein